MPFTEVRSLFTRYEKRNAAGGVAHASRFLLGLTLVQRAPLVGRLHSLLNDDKSIEQN